MVVVDGQEDGEVFVRADVEVKEHFAMVGDLVVQLTECENGNVELFSVAAIDVYLVPRKAIKVKEFVFKQCVLLNSTAVVVNRVLRHSGVVEVAVKHDPAHPAGIFVIDGAEEGHIVIPAIEVVHVHHPADALEAAPLARRVGVKQVPHHRVLTLV